MTDSPWARLEWVGVPPYISKILDMDEPEPMDGTHDGYATNRWEYTFATVTSLARSLTHPLTRSLASLPPRPLPSPPLVQSLLRGLRFSNPARGVVVAQ
jgi:hypothetical protein